MKIVKVFGVTRGHIRRSNVGGCRHTGLITGVVALLALASIVPAVQAAPINLFNTGVDNSSVVLPDGTIGDPHYILQSAPGGTSDIRVRTSAGGFPIPPYIGDNSFSAWIGPNNSADLTSSPGTYDYRTTFSLVGFNPATAAISGGWTSDNDGIKILINGVDTGNPGTDFAQFSLGFAPFTISGGFMPGLNTLDFIVNNGGSSDNPTALRVELSGTALATPLPAALPLFAGGVGIVGLLVRRRKRKLVAA